MEDEVLEVVREIKAYIKYLIFNVKLDVSLCDFYNRMPIEISDYLSNFMIHPNFYCQKIKATCMRNCLRQQMLVKKKALNCKKPFFGSCYAGVYEYISPIIENNVYYGFISVTGYQSPSSRSFINPELSKLHKIYEKSLKTEVPSKEFLEKLIAPLKNSFKLLTYYYDINEIKAKNNHDYLYQTILRYVSENYLRPLTMPIIAEELHYSVSYLSHIFKERNSLSIMQYAQHLKIKKAKDFLRSTDKSVAEISELLGFQDSNYFSAVFKKSTGLSPRNYRAKQRDNAYPPFAPTE